MGMMSRDAIPANAPRVVALTQVRRGHGQSTAAYYLARALVNDGLRVLVADLTGRRARLQALMTAGTAKNLGLWAAPVPKPSGLRALLDEARRTVAGRVDVLLLDTDAALLEGANDAREDLDYLCVLAETSLLGQAAADRIAERLDDEPPPYGKIGVIFTRVDAPGAGDLPERTNGRGLPVIGYTPADYLLAAGDDYSLKGGEPSTPHDTYLSAEARIARYLVRTIPLRRAALGGVTVPGVSDIDRHATV